MKLYVFYLQPLTSILTAITLIHWIVLIQDSLIHFLQEYQK